MAVTPKLTAQQKCCTLRIKGEGDKHIGRVENNKIKTALYLHHNIAS